MNSLLDGLNRAQWAQQNPNEWAQQGPNWPSASLSLSIPNESPQVREKYWPEYKKMVGQSMGKDFMRRFQASTRPRRKQPAWASHAPIVTAKLNQVQRGSWAASMAAYGEDSSRSASIHIECATQENKN